MSKHEEIAAMSVKAAEFIRTASKPAEEPGGARDVARADYLKFMDENGAPKAMLEQVSVLNSAVIAGAAEVATDDLVAAIDEAKKSGDDPTNLESRVMVRTVDGRVQARVQAQREVRIPGPSGKTAMQQGRLSVRAFISGGVTKSPAAAAAERIAEALKAK